MPGFLHTSSAVGGACRIRPFQEETSWAYRDVLENIHVGIVVLDTSLQAVAYCNPALAAMLSALGIPADFVALRDLLAFDRETAGSGEVAGFTRTVQQHNRLYGYRIYRISPQHICLFVHDITEKARLESIAQTVNAMDNIGMIFSGIRHEIGNPLNSMKMAMSVLRANLDSFSAETVTAYIDRAQAEIARMEYLLRALKSFSMFESYDIRRVEMGEFVAGFVRLMQDELTARRITVRFEPPSGPLPVRVDPRALHQVLLNLFANAADALAGQTKPEIVVELAADEGLGWLCVHDNGCGMDGEQLRQLFIPFHTSKAGGNGLGLAITRKLLAGMDGSIEFASQVGRGTSATIALPLAVAGSADMSLFEESA